MKRLYSAVAVLIAIVVLNVGHTSHDVRLRHSNIHNVTRRAITVRRIAPVTHQRPRRRPTLASRSEPFGNVAITPWTPFVATWYSDSGGSDGSGITRMGTTPQNGFTIAVDPNVIPLGSLVEIRFSDGTTRTYQAQDTGSAIVGDRIDIFDPNTSECFANGRRDVEVRVIRQGAN